MFKKAILWLTCMCVCVSFCGCAFVGDNDELVSPPELTGELSLIADALYDVAGEELDLEYPTAGQYRSAIILEDINGDDTYEAFAFYNTANDEMNSVHINVICQQDGAWVSVADQTMIATGVEKVEFCDLDGDGGKEILVGWDVNGSSEKKLSVFTFGESKLEQKLIQSYTNFLCLDLDFNNSSELFVHFLSAADKTNKAMVFNLKNNEMVQTMGCLMDASVKSAAVPVASVLPNGQRAIYIDEIKGVGSVTEVLYVSSGELVNPLLDSEITFENISTYRAASIETKDIDGDGILEIPVASDLPNAQIDGEKLYYTNWCTFDGTKLSAKKVTIMNTVDGYYLTVPKTIIGYVAVEKNIESHVRKFYHYDSINNILGRELFTITAVDINDWVSSDYERGNKQEISRTESTVFVAELGDGAESFLITIDLIKDTFYLVE